MNDFDRAERAALASTKSSTDLVARLRAYAVEYEQWNETSHYAPFKRDLYEAADALEAAEAQNLALIERLESLQFENLTLREAQNQGTEGLDEETARILNSQNPDSAEQAGARIIALSQALSDLTAALNVWMECADGPTQYDADVAWLKLGEAQLKAMNALRPENRTSADPSKDSTDAGSGS